ncbi:NfeD family protein, partial [Musicola paradisiaca]
WAWQSVSFALLTIITALLWWHWLRQRSRKEPISTLNQRGRQLLGRHATLTEPLVNGIGRIDIGDSSWRVQAERDLPAGTVVEIVDVEGITLKVKPNA